MIANQRNRQNDVNEEQYRYQNVNHYLSPFNRTPTPQMVSMYS